MTANRSLTTVVLTLLLCATLAAPAAAGNLSCDAVNEADASLWARYLDTADRTTFELSVKVPEANKGQVKRTWSVFLDERRLGELELTPKADGSLTGSLSFDSYADRSNGTPHVRPFPSNWAHAGRGATVRVESLSCKLSG